ncbi:MAG: crotonase/enoyl-CoA hydratase family protein [Dehalococcoidia bacterium]|nr:crotonase/enoyl-CoA hydratase family protein [Dehalococcoidia bacterium]
MDYSHIKYEIADRILTITLNRPEKLNAVTVKMLFEIIDAFDRADEDDDVRAVIVTGAGRGFCAGADLGGGGEIFDFSAVPVEKHRDEGGLVTLRIYDMKKPVIGAINGPATGVGVTMTLPMDIRLASDNAKFGLVFGRRGLNMEACSSWFLPRVVNFSKAAEWVLTGRLFDAREALAGGLVSEVTAPEYLLPRARELAREIAQNTSAISTALNRQLLWKMVGADHPMEAHKIDSKGLYYLGTSADAREGIAAWAEKRKPDFKMKPSADMPPFYPWWSKRTFETR